MNTDFYSEGIIFDIYSKTEAYKNFIDTAIEELEKHEVSPDSVLVKFTPASLGAILATGYELIIVGCSVKEERLVTIKQFVSVV